MKFTVERDVLADAVAWTSRAVPARPPVPVLAGVRITADTEGMARTVSYRVETVAAPARIGGAAVAAIGRMTGFFTVDSALACRGSAC